MGVTRRIEKDRETLCFVIGFEARSSTFSWLFVLMEVFSPFAPTDSKDPRKNLEMEGCKSKYFSLFPSRLRPVESSLIVISSRQNRDPTTYQSDMSLNSARF